MKPRLTIAVISIACMNAACAQVAADSAFRVSGSIIDEQGNPIDSCSLDVVFHDRESPSYTKKIDSKFVNTFTVSPGPHKFYLVVQCGEGWESYRSSLIEISGTERYDNPISLDDLVMKRTGKD